MIPAAGSPLPTAGPALPTAPTSLQPGAMPGQPSLPGSGWKYNFKLPQKPNPAAQVQPPQQPGATAAGIQQAAQKVAGSDQTTSWAAQPTWLLKGLEGALEASTGFQEPVERLSVRKNAGMAGLPPVAGLTAVAPPPPGTGMGMPPPGPPPRTMGGAAPPLPPTTSPDPMMNGPNPGMPAPGMPGAPPPGAGAGTAGAAGAMGGGAPPITPPMSDPPPQPLPTNPQVNPPRPRTSTDAINDAVLLQGNEQAQGGPLSQHDVQEDMAAQMAGANTKLARLRELLNYGIEKSSDWRGELGKGFMSFGKKYAPRVFGAAESAAPKMPNPVQGAGRFPGTFTPPPPSTASRILPAIGTAGKAIGKQIAPSAGGAIGGALYGPATTAHTTDPTTGQDVAHEWGTGDWRTNAMAGAAAFNPWLRGKGVGQFLTNPVRASIIGGDAGGLGDLGARQLGLRDTNFGRIGAGIGAAGGGMQSLGQAGSKGSQILGGTGSAGRKLQDFGEAFGSVPGAVRDKTLAYIQGTTAKNFGGRLGGLAAGGYGANMAFEGMINRGKEEARNLVDTEAPRIRNYAAGEIFGHPDPSTGEAVPGLLDQAKQHITHYGDEYLNTRAPAIKDYANHAIQEKLNSLGLTNTQGRFSLLGHADQGLGNVMSHLGVDWANMHPVQKLMLLGGGATAGAGALTMNPWLAGAGGAAMMGGMAPQWAGYGYGSPPGSPQGTQPASWFMRNGGTVPPPNVPVARDEFQAAQG